MYGLFQPVPMRFTLLTVLTRLTLLTVLTRFTLLKVLPRFTLLTVLARFTLLKRIRPIQIPAELKRLPYCHARSGHRRMVWGMLNDGVRLNAGAA